jgi:prevent-host-death family protein
MLAVNIHEAKTHLSRLVEDAAQGKAFIIAKAGKPMVKVVPFAGDGLSEQRRLGFMAGEFSVPDDFDRFGEVEITAVFEGRER